MHIALCRIPNYSFIVLACCGIGLDIDTQRTIKFQFESKREKLVLVSCKWATHRRKRTHIVASSFSGFSLSPPSTPSASRSAATPASLSRSCCSLSPSISRSEACFAILNFSVSSLKISAAWFVGLCCERVWLWFALSVWWVRESWAREDWRDCRCCVRN